VSQDTPSFEAALKELEAIVQRLERGDLALEESLKLYEDGVRLARLCHTKLEQAEGRIEQLVKNARGEAVVDASGEPRTRPLSVPDDDRSA
jgi:exodeoxyribonuclease VII small subunit